jgi:hypothetical protein
MERTLGLGEEYRLLHRAYRNLADVLDRDANAASRAHIRLEQRAREAAAVILRERKVAFGELVRALFEAQALDGDHAMRILRERQ